MEIIEDDRADSKYITEYFVYLNTNYPRFYIVYTYLFNIDLRYPYIPIGAETYEKILGKGIIYK